MESLEEKVARVTKELVSIVPHEHGWSKLANMEAQHLRECLPADQLGRIEHFGSTAVPGLSAKPIIDLLVEVKSLEEARLKIAPLLEAQGYDYFWRSALGDHEPPFYAWFIKRNAQGVRTHHIHMVEGDSALWDRLLFRDYLIAHPGVAYEYGRLKRRLAEEYPNDRVAYTRGKDGFIAVVMGEARRYFRSSGQDGRASAKA